MNDMTPEAKQNINRSLREMGAKNNITVEPIPADDLLLGLFFKLAGSIQTFGQVRSERVPELLRKLANHMDVELSELGTPPTGTLKGGLL